MTTRAQRNQHLRFAAKILRTMFSAAEDTDCSVNRVTLRQDDDPPFDLMTLTPEGANIIALLLDTHECRRGHDGERICPVLYLAWVIEGCPQSGESLTEALRRNEFRIAP